MLREQETDTFLPLIIMPDARVCAQGWIQRGPSGGPRVAQVRHPNHFLHSGPGQNGLTVPSGSPESFSAVPSGACLAHST